MRSPSANQDRVARHRRKLKQRGAKRLEVVVPQADADLIKAIAAKLRAGGPDADALRAETGRLVDLPQAQTGEDLFAMFQCAGGLGDEIDFQRDRGGGRTAEFEKVSIGVRLTSRHKRNQRGDKASSQPRRFGLDKGAGPAVLVSRNTRHR